ncbi:MAG: hypothetical protein HC813_01970 [Planctomycetes bacterium]|nr:hypothetical protein [Planctomycetota bacterium]
MRSDRSQDGVDAPTGSWIDLVITVDPGGETLPLEGLAVSADAGGEGEFGEATLPPPDGEAGYRAPFEIRLPVMLGGASKVTIAVAVKGKGFEIAGEGAVYGGGAYAHHVTGSATLRDIPAIVGKPNAILFELSVLPPYHVYGTEGAEEGQPFTVELLPAGPERLWSGGERFSPEGNHLEGAFRVELPFTPLRAGPVTTRALLFWQACTEQICEPNEVAYLPLSFEVEPGEEGELAVTPPLPTARAGGSGGGDDLSQKSTGQLVLLSILGALFALAMPCTYPLIPITISFFTKQAEARHGKVLPLALAYGAGIVVIFAAIGFLVGSASFGAESVLDFATNWIVNLFFALLFLVFGLSLVGLYEIRLPTFLNDVAARASGSGGYLSVFAMGATLVITSFTCTAPVVGALLVWGSKSGEVGVVTGMMAVFGLTMAIPFVLLSLSPKAIQNMPRSGIWMKHLKVTLGIVELGLVLKFVSNIDLAIGTFAIGRTLFLALWGLSFLAATLYLVFAEGARTKGRLLSAAVLLAVTIYLGTGFGGRALHFANLEAFLPQIGQDAYAVAFPTVVKDDYAAGLAKARESNLPIFLHFTGFQ